MKIQVPGFPPERSLLFLVGGYTLIGCAILIVTSHPLRSPMTLPWTRFDEAVPLVPASVFIYLSHFPFVFTTLFFLKERENVNRVAASIFLATLLTLPFFFAAPTQVPRSQPLELPGLAGTLFRLIDLRFSNCFPSMHVGYAYLAALGYRDEQRRWYLPALGGVVLISLSTVLTKQHYLVDLPAGLAFAWGCRAFVDRFVEFRFQDVAAPGVNDGESHAS